MRDLDFHKDELLISVCFEVIQGHQRSKIAEKGQISNLIQNIQIIPQNVGLGVSFSKKFVSRSLKVIKGQKSEKKVKLRTLSMSK